MSRGGLCYAAMWINNCYSGCYMYVHTFAQYFILPVTGYIGINLLSPSLNRQVHSCSNSAAWEKWKIEKRNILIGCWARNSQLINLACLFLRYFSLLNIWICSMNEMNLCNWWTLFVLLIVCIECSVILLTSWPWADWLIQSSLSCIHIYSVYSARCAA